MAHLEHELLALIRSHYHQPQPTEQEAAESLKRLRELLDAPKTRLKRLTLSVLDKLRRKRVASSGI
jgi:hypothetical protein